MARPREFDTEEALNRGMQVFWRKGYESTSLDDLLGAMRLSRSSFYTAFGSKHDFLIAAINHYTSHILEEFASALDQGSARDAIARTFNSVIDRSGRTPAGCFVHNCTVELAHRDPRVRSAVRRGLRQLEDAYCRAIKRGQKTGEIPHSLDARAQARYLTSALNGLQVLARTETDRASLSEVAKIALSTLK
jgi:TetR/AcrR family transcriptional repressor of nem operon